MSKREKPPQEKKPNVLKRVDLASAALFLKEGKVPGHPRFTSRLHDHWLTFKQCGKSLMLYATSKKNRGMLELARLGQVKMVWHREIKGTPTGQWFVTLTVEVAEKEVHDRHLSSSEDVVGVAGGLQTFASLSTQEAIANPRFFRAEEARLARAGRTKKRMHERIAVEALIMRTMVKNPGLATSIADASWSLFFTRLVAKAQEAGRQVVCVNPACTSQTCSHCGHRQPMPLSVQVYEIPHCGLIMHRDHHGSLNILAGGLQACGRASHVIPLSRSPRLVAVGSRHTG